MTQSRGDDALLRSALDGSSVGLALYRARPPADGAPIAFERRYANPAAIVLGGSERRGAATSQDVSIFAHVLTAGGADQREVERKVVDLGPRWVLETVRPIAGGVVAEFEDVTEARRRADAADLLTRELSHRIKNVLAVVTSLVSLTSRGAEDKASFVDGLRGRLAALARAHDVNSPLRSGGACSIGDLFRSVLSPYQGPRESSAGLSRIDVDACEHWVGPTAATGLALLIHELATNALKHGALSNETGWVSLRCELVGAQMRICWRERGGPAIQAEPLSSGFGLQMSQRVLTGQLDGSIVYAWDAEGLTAEMVVACRRLSA